MNYRHAYHAGNFADVLKHAVLAAVITYLKEKPTPFRVIDTHAGIGVYDLSAREAQKTGEWQGGIGRIYGTDLPSEIADLLAPYLEAVAAENVPGVLERYPGSPAIARHLLRPGDVLVANELHPDDVATLETQFARDRQTKVLNLDAWVALKSLLPPKERRGVILIDPPFEEPGELQRMVQGLKDAHRRFATGILLLWYPIKDRAQIAAFHREIIATGIPKILNAELTVRPASEPGQLLGTGLVILNPPYKLERTLHLLLSFLADRLADDKGGSYDLAWLRGEGVTSL